MDVDKKKIVDIYRKVTLHRVIGIAKKTPYACIGDELVK